MNKAAIKKYAPAARKAFIAAVTRRAELLGLAPGAPPSIEHDGDVMLINGQAFSAEIESQRDALEQRIAREGFDVVMDAMAYTWFNRLVAIRYMELHGYLGHGYRTLSHPDDSDGKHNQPEILDHLTDVEMPGLDKAHALDLKLAGNRDEELYREVLLAQCHALHTAMPFLFEPIDDATELLLPDGLLRTDSLVRQLVTAIDEESWQQVEIIGWLYQFYISEKKDQVIGKVVKSEDIPAATQLFTPNWIVKYLVQNSLGRLWLMANPNSQLASKWEYYIQPAEQTPEVNAQLDALIQARIAEDGSTLNPESLTLLDPACGSGHILVEAYDLLRDIYLERGYRRQVIPRLILEKNLYGLEIDDRAAQLAGFALLMKARADDRRLLGQPVALNVLALQETKADSANDLHSALNAPQISNAAVSQLVETFEKAKIFGSLIQITDELASALPDMRQGLEAVRDGGDMLGRDAAETLLRIVAQAEVLARQFDAVVANPPYMGGNQMNTKLKGFVRKCYPSGKRDLFTCFIQRGSSFAKSGGFNAMVTMDSWMFLSSFSDFRLDLLANSSFASLVHIGWNCFPEVHAFHRGVAFVLVNEAPNGFGDFVNLSNVSANIDKEALYLERIASREDTYNKNHKAFLEIPGSPIAYWISPAIQSAFRNGVPLKEIGNPKVGMQTSNNERYLRFWHEINYQEFMESGTKKPKWIKYLKGGGFRRWYGNLDYVLRYNAEPEFIKAQKNATVLPESRLSDIKCTWTDVTSGKFHARYAPPDTFHDISGHCFYPSKEKQYELLAFVNTKQFNALLDLINPTIHAQVSDVGKLPYINTGENVGAVAKKLVDISMHDWNLYERSWDFIGNPLVEKRAESRGSLKRSYGLFWEESTELAKTCKLLEEDINSKFIRSYGFEEDFDSNVDLHDVSLTSNPAYRYGPSATSKIQSQRFRGDACAELVSYSVGCMMGRYSLDAPGLIYALAGNEGFNPCRYTTFPADDDGIVPITDEAWFGDDGANRIREFVRVVWGEEAEAENMAWLAESLGKKASESADDAIRRYLTRDFYKDHLQTYKKRPIYWLFSSGKHKAFEALVYLHRYNAGTLSRMRMQYVVPLQSKMQSRIDRLDEDAQSSGSSAEQKRLQKQRDKLAKQLEELRRFDEELRHYADQRISLNLDDGVKENYKKFGALLAERKSVTGEK